MAWCLVKHRDNFNFTFTFTFTFILGLYIWDGKTKDSWQSSSKNFLNLFYLCGYWLCASVPFDIDNISWIEPQCLYLHSVLETAARKVM
jgi:hypothetical protein